MPSAKVLTTSDDAFKADVLESSVTVLVDFWAPWCGPCRMIAPIMDDLAEDFDGKLKVVKVNIDDCAKVAAEYGIRSIPTLLIFKGGQVVLTITGAQPKSAIYQKVTPLI